ncbi:hypothetical protein DFA_10341 [Cavenderia fasciculata]|uniref:Uncharacterized protein n=1 Tax=Cavenderia fasciculata TaxID=261658 RepID=F4Q9Y2_CACFS|nr:uncharacterized protein DFA_10341 [Cavenderia fasciculata]EGG15501.1 hypothetical protein DFA_10341 [Cavenderia fasciculata]|eukprot:XP_004354243.1 hypothetical protein DFA_10341 [Cavenderia fasciculata]
MDESCEEDLQVETIDVPTTLTLKEGGYDWSFIPMHMISLATTTSPSSLKILFG